MAGSRLPMQTGKELFERAYHSGLEAALWANVRFIVLSSAKVITDQVVKDLLAGFPPSRVGGTRRSGKEPKLITVASIHSMSQPFG